MRSRIDDEGSAWAARFTLYLPLAYIGPATPGRVAGIEAAPRAPMPSATPVRLAERPQEAMADDRHSIQPGDTVLLIVEDDPHYARVLVDLAHDHGLKVLVALRGADALSLARDYQPTAVSLDVFLPDMLGWTVLSQLKQESGERGTSRCRSSRWTKTASMVWRTAFRS